MGANTAIEWANHTFNPWRGCTKISAGCEHCYAETLSARNHGALGVWGLNGTRVVAAESMWRQPLKWDRDAAEARRFYEEYSAAAKATDPKYDAPAPSRPRVFCASLADVFEDWRGTINESGGTIDDSAGRILYTISGDSWFTEPLYPECRDLTMAGVRARLFSLIDQTPNLDWLLLTKRPENIAAMMPSGVRRNVWLGTSVEDQETAEERIPHLLAVPAAVHFLSCEPLLGPIDLTRFLGDAHEEFQTGPVPAGINWVIVGGESGPHARAMTPAWVRSIRDQCADANVPLFFKQWGEHDQRGIRVGKRAAGAMLDGRRYEEFPAP